MNKDIINRHNNKGREAASYSKNCRQQLKGALLELRNAESGEKNLPWEEHTNWLFNTKWVSLNSRHVSSLVETEQIVFIYL